MEYNGPDINQYRYIQEIAAAAGIFTSICLSCCCCRPLPAFHGTISSLVLIGTGGIT